MSEVYHTGYLPFDRERPHRLNACRCDLCSRAAAVAVVADAYWRAYERGEVVLVQRRLDPERFEYIAKRTGRPA